MYKRAIVYLSCILIQACSLWPNSETWPAELPPRQTFVDACQNCSSQELHQHLLWVKRFYQGSILYPTGWVEMTDLLTSSLEHDGDKITTKRRLDDLGLKIVLEWVKNNNERLINSQQLAIWGRALRTSAENNEQIDFITTVEQDVENILSEKLKPEEITQERYYPAEDYDNF